METLTEHADTSQNMNVNYVGIWESIETWVHEVQYGIAAAEDVDDDLPELED